MCLRWTAGGMLEAEVHARRVIGHGDLAKLAVAVERDVATTRAAATTTTTPHTPATTAAPEAAASPA